MLIKQIEKLSSYPEILYFERGKVKVAGSTEQLWTLGAIKAMVGERSVLDSLSLSLEKWIKKFRK